LSQQERRAQAPRLFGTDGIRGIANQHPITSEIALRLGRALAEVFRRPAGSHSRVLIGKDTRLSGYMLETAMASGICSVGADVLLVGPLPTPAIAYLTRTMRAAAGVVISASHNPFQDNGIKFFNREGFKLDDELERRIEELVSDDRLIERASAEDVGKAIRIDDAIGRYLVFLKACLPRDCLFDGLKLVIDCAHGAAYKVGPELLAELGADVIAIGVEPDGKNINFQSGTLHLSRLRERVLSSGADLGVALDGDADRALFVDARGEVFDGDEVMAIMGRALSAAGKLAGNAVVATVMSNLGLEQALAEVGIGLVRTEVGDPAVSREMRLKGYNFGGEQSGHLIFMDHSTTGDGLITTLLLLEQILKRGRGLAEMRVMHRFPQVLHNVRVARRLPLSEMPEVQRAITAVRARLGPRSRVLVRYSGTEMVARVMVEGEDLSKIKACAQEIGALIERQVGQPN